MSKYSRIIAGCMSWRKWGKNLSQKEMISQISLTIESGITTFDHADIYGDYTTEAEFGNAFAKTKIEREEVQLISKCGIQYVGESRSNKIKHYNYSKDYIIWSVEESLKNLKTDYLDLLLLHRPSPLMDPKEIAIAIILLKEQGKILDFGVSNFTVSQMLLLEKHLEISSNQLEFSLSQHESMHNGVLDYLLENEKNVMSWSPLGTVFKEENEENLRVKKTLKSLCSKYGATEDQLLLAWVLKHPAKIYPVIGTTTKERIHNAVKAEEIDLELEDWFELLVAQQGHKVP